MNFMIYKKLEKQIRHIFCKPRTNHFPLSFDDIQSELSSHKGTTRINYEYVFFVS